MPTTTISALVHLAAEDLGVITPGETLSAALLANGTTRLKDLYASWALEELMAVPLHMTSTAVIAGTTDYTFGIGGTLSSVGVAPIKITGWQSRSGNFKNGGVPISFAKFNEAVKDNLATSAQLVQYLAADSGGPYNNDTKLINVRIWPTPAASPGSLAIDYLSYADQIVDPLTLPAGWVAALRTNLALDWAPQFAREGGKVPEALAANALNRKLAIMQLNASILGLPMPQ